MLQHDWICIGHEINLHLLPARTLRLFLQPERGSYPESTSARCSCAGVVTRGRSASEIWRGKDLSCVEGDHDAWGPQLARMSFRTLRGLGVIDESKPG